MNDLDKLQENVKEIINHLDIAIITLLKQNEIMTDQYEKTLNHLEKINSTIFALAGIIKDFNVEKLLKWFNETITENGNDDCFFLLFIFINFVNIFFVSLYL